MQTTCPEVLSVNDIQQILVLAAAKRMNWLNQVNSMSSGSAKPSESIEKCF